MNLSENFTTSVSKIIKAINPRLLHEFRLLGTDNITLSVYQPEDSPDDGLCVSNSGYNEESAIKAFN